MSFWGFFKKIGRVFKKIFGSKKVQEALLFILEKIVPEAIPIVEEIRAIVKDPGNASYQDIIDVYNKMGIVVPQIINTAEGRGNALLNLATAKLRALIDNKGWKDISTSDLHTAIEQALTALKAEE